MNHFRPLCQYSWAIALGVCSLLAGGATQAAAAAAAKTEPVFKSLRSNPAIKAALEQIRSEDERTLAMGRAGLGIRRAGIVSESGTPRFALGLTSLAAALLIVTGTFEPILALGVVLFVFNYISAYAAVFILRRREPTLPRPYRAFGYPVSTAVVLLGSVLFLVAAVVGDRRSAIIAAGLFIVSIPAYAFTVRRRNSAPSAS
jgi:APA family basic amino acid/polyamine antiporter